MGSEEEEAEVKAIRLARPGPSQGVFLPEWADTHEYGHISH